MSDALIRRTVAALVIFILGTFAGIYAERASHRPRIEAHAAELRQADQSLILERNPERPAPKPPQIPKGSKVTRVTTIQIEPTAPVQSGAIAVQSGAIAVQLTQIDGPEGSRVIASTEDGRVIGGADWTGPALQPPRMPRWEIQALRTWQDGRGAAWGASLAYSRGPVVGSVAVVPGFHQLTVGIGLRW